MISKRFVLTAAHCADASDYFQINGREIAHTNTVLHPLYDDYTMNYDIALYELSEEITDVPYLRLSPETINEVGTPMTVIGVGDTEGYLHKRKKQGNGGSDLKKADLELVSIEDCRVPYVPYGEDEYIHEESMICAQKFGGDRYVRCVAFYD